MKKSAYGVHLLTATGAALGLWSLILIFDGFYKEAIWVLAGAVLVDSIDGTLARYFNVGEHAPKIDGALMENIIDFLTWTVAPLCWIYATMHIPIWVLLICAISSVLAFSNKEAKSSDYFFTGFPSYWNIVVLYLFLLDLSPVFASACLLIFAVSSLLPVKFVYPSRTTYLQGTTLALAGLYFVQLIAIIILFDDSPPLLVYSSFIFPIYYFALSLYVNINPSETLPNT